MNRPLLTLKLKESPKPTIRIRNITEVECPMCGAFRGERCERGSTHWQWCAERILISDGKMTDPRDDDPQDADDFHAFIDDNYDYEAEEEERTAKAKAHLRSLSNEDLGKEWDRECRRHDSSVDRCEAMNNPTIESAQMWMNFIERLFKNRGVSHHDFVMKDEGDS